MDVVSASLWYLPLAAFVLIFLVFTPVLVWQITKRVTEGTTEVDAFGLKIKTPYASLAMSLVGIGGMVYVIPMISAEQKVRVTDVALAVDGRTGPNVLTWHTPCPATVTLSGTITALGEGTVTYRFIRSIGTQGDQVTRTPAATVDFGGRKTATVTDKVVVPFPKGTYYYTDVLKITDPGARETDPVGFTVWCDPTTKPAPQGMPPPPEVTPPGG